MSLALKLFNCFHLNLSYSSIEEEQHVEVVQRCYWPLLRLADEHDVPVGIELSGLTLEQIKTVDPEWTGCFKRLLQEKKCELIGSGYVQLIGPLVPAVVNHANQRHGIEAYQRILGVMPRIALVNEQAWSISMVDHYLDAGYEAVIMEWDNPAEQHKEWPREWRYHPQRVGTEEKSLSLLWNQSILFQRFQRYVHGELILEDYIAELSQHISGQDRCLALYGNDVEVFDFRPGRFNTESQLEEGTEWGRIERLIKCLRMSEQFELILPSMMLEYHEDDECNGWNMVDLQSPLFPVPVKKQRKYNIGRWAISGRDDLWLNSKCHAFSKLIDSPDTLGLKGSEIEMLEKEVCELWSSDLRTHLTQRRWDRLLNRLDQLSGKYISHLRRVNSSENCNAVIERLDSQQIEKSKQVEWGETKLRWDQRRRYLHIENRHVECSLNLFRGASFRSLAYRSHCFEPVIGTITQGYFEEIGLGADYYSGVVVAELSAEHSRVTDLTNPNEWFVERTEKGVVVTAKFRHSKGHFSKKIELMEHEEKVRYSVDLSNWEREQGTVRVGHFTLSPPVEKELLLRCKNGGSGWETIDLGQQGQHKIRQGSPASTLVTSTSGLGSSSGEIIVSHGEKELCFEWNPVECALFPMLDMQPATPSALVRILFSLSEMDETWREGGHLLPFTISLSPH